MSTTAPKWNPPQPGTPTYSSTLKPSTGNLPWTVRVLCGGRS